LCNFPFKMKTAVLIGATGLVGGELLKLLLKDHRFNKVRVFVRRSTGIVDSKLEEHLVDFNQVNAWSPLVQGDVLYSALGTTIKKAGSKDAQYQIDFTYQYQFAKVASDNKIPVYVLVSSSGASSKSSIFYSRIKGELEDAVKKLNFPSIHIMQPSLLVGDRQEQRKGESFAYHFLNGLNALGLFRRFKPIEGKTVAMAMLNCSLSEMSGTHTHVLDAIFEKAKVK